MIKIACIPAYDEESIIGNVIKRTFKYVDRVIVCDDGSSDKTADVAQANGAEIIKHNKNKGKGAALRSLFDYVKKTQADIIITMDGDGQFLPEEIPTLIAPIIEKKADIVIGNRFNDESEMPSYRKVGNKLLDKMTNMASELPFSDTQSGFRAYSKKAIEMVRFTTDGFGADSEILIDAAKKGFKISEEKVTVLYNTGTETSTKNPMSHTSEVIVSLIEAVAIRHPLKYLGIPGILFLIFGVAYSIIVISIFNETRYFSIPSTLISIGSLITGLMLLLMSVVLFSIQRAMKRN